jgi:hypothetical protein
MSFKNSLLYSSLKTDIIKRNRSGQGTVRERVGRVAKRIETRLSKLALAWSLGLDTETAPTRPPMSLRSDSTDAGPTERLN